MPTHAQRFPQFYVDLEINENRQIYCFCKVYRTVHMCGGEYLKYFFFKFAPKFSEKRIQMGLILICFPIYDNHISMWKGEVRVSHSFLKFPNKTKITIHPGSKERRE